MQGREVVIVEAVRTPVGRGHPEKGAYRDVHPVALLAHVYEAVVERAGIDPALVEDVLAGCVHQLGEQQYNVARNAWLHAGLPVETPALTLDRQCGSAQQAVNLGATLIAAGVHDVVIGAGVEHMGHLPFTAGAAVMAELGSPYTPELLERHQLVPQGLCAELIAEQWEISREECDAFALRSQQRAARAAAEGRFEREIDAGRDTRRPRHRRSGDPAGHHPRRARGAEAGVQGGREAHRRQLVPDLRRCRCDPPDGAPRADELGLRPRARVVDQTTVGVDPVIMLTGPIPATRRILERNGLTLDDIDLIEINEAFASVVLAWEKELQPDMDRVNVNGGAIALGHPIGSTGARLLTTLLHELERTERPLRPRDHVLRRWTRDGDADRAALTGGFLRRAAGPSGGPSYIPGRNQKVRASVARASRTAARCTWSRCRRGAQALRCLGEPHAARIRLVQLDRDLVGDPRDPLGLRAEGRARPLGVPPEAEPADGGVDEPGGEPDHEDGE